MRTMMVLMLKTHDDTAIGDTIEDAIGVVIEDALSVPESVDMMLLMQGWLSSNCFWDFT